MHETIFDWNHWLLNIKTAELQAPDKGQVHSECKKVR